MFPIDEKINQVMAILKQIEPIITEITDSFANHQIQTKLSELQFWIAQGLTTSVWKKEMEAAANTGVNASSDPLAVDEKTQVETDSAVVLRNNGIVELENNDQTSKI